MKKIKLAALSLLAITTAGALASCGGGKTPTQKEDVYLRAKSYTLGPGGKKLVSYENDECATIEVEDKENLKYEKQDVVIHVKPKKFFTFREYNTENWTAIGRPVKPYVGLGSPISLYNYPLQENVAWTFEDKSTEIKDESGKFIGFYNEDYQITVKKEFFQKNIVIDYGNVKTLNNGIYAYNSTKYQRVFEDPKTLVGNYKNEYTVNETLSKFTAAGPGVTATYSFSSTASPLYTFRGWDNAPVAPTTNDDKPLEYSNFKVIAYKKGDTVGTNIATYKPGLDKSKQDFVPTVSDDYRSISFFIKWGVLAEDVEKGYAPKFEKIEIQFEKPSLKVKDTNPVVGDDITVYHHGFFKPSKTGDVPYGNDGTLTIENVGEFKNMYAEPPTEGTNPIYYSVLFELKDTSKKDCFSITINDLTYDIDLLNKPVEYTRARIETYQQQSIEGESELPVWRNIGGWTLAQLNPDANDKGNPQRTYGLPPSFVGKENLYYLYTDNTSVVDSLLRFESINIKIDYTTPKFVTFALDKDSQEFGTLTQEKFAYVGENRVDIPFEPKTGYESSNFDVKLEGKYAEDFSATYTPRGQKRIIHIEGIAGAQFKEGSFTITLTQPDTVVALSQRTQKVGNLIDENNQPVTKYLPTIMYDQEKFVFTFVFKEEYHPTISGYDPKQPEKSDWRIDATLNGESLDINVKPNDKYGNYAVDVSGSITGGIAKKGFVFDIDVRYIEITLGNEPGFSEPTLEFSQPLWDIVDGYFNEFSFTLKTSATIEDGNYDVMVNPNKKFKISSVEFIIDKDNPTNAIIKIYFGEEANFENGTAMTVNISRND